MRLLLLSILLTAAVNVNSHVYEDDIPRGEMVETMLAPELGNSTGENSEIGDMEDLLGRSRWCRRLNGICRSNKALPNCPDGYVESQGYGKPYCIGKYRRCCYPKITGAESTISSTTSNLTAHTTRISTTIETSTKNPKGYCPDGTFRYPPSQQCFVLLTGQKLTWYEAREECQKKGLVLARPNSPVALRKYILETYDKYSQPWLNARSNGKDFIWQNNGDVLANDDPLWYPGKPGSRTSDQYCLLFLVHPTSIEQHPEKPYWPSYCGWRSPIALCESICPEGTFWYPPSQQCFAYLTGKRLTWYEAREECQKKGLVLARPNSPVALREHLTTFDKHSEPWINARSNGKDFIWQNNGDVLAKNDPLWWPGMPGSRTSNQYCLLLRVNKGFMEQQPEKPYWPSYCGWRSPIALCETDVETSNPSTAFAVTTHSTTIPTTIEISTKKAQDTYMIKGYKVYQPGYLWTVKQCPNILHTIQPSLESCVSDCENTDGCTGFNYVADYQYCNMWNCTIPAPEPTAFWDPRLVTYSKLPEPDCPEDKGFFKLPESENQCFKVFSSQRMTWNDAKKQCETEGLSLAKLNDAEAAVAMRKLLVDKYGLAIPVWLGASGAGSGVIKWIRDGTTFTTYSAMHPNHNSGRTTSNYHLILLSVRGWMNSDPNTPYFMDPYSYTWYPLCELVA